MKKKLTIALVAHDNRKVDMIDWAVFNADFLAAHNLVCTGTTGTLIRDAFEQRGIEYSNIRCMHSGPGRYRNCRHGGTQGDQSRRVSDRRPQPAAARGRHPDAPATVPRSQRTHRVQPLQR